MQSADHPAGSDRDGEAKAEVDRRHLPADQSEQQPERDLVDHRRGDQERERDAERNAGADEADEQRHRGARAKGRDDAEAGRRDIAEPLATTGEKRAGALR